MGYRFVSPTGDENIQMRDLTYISPLSVAYSAFSVPTPKVLEDVDSLRIETSHFKGTK